MALSLYRANWHSYYSFDGPCYASTVEHPVVYRDQVIPAHSEDEVREVILNAYDVINGEVVVTLIKQLEEE